MDKDFLRQIDDVKDFLSSKEKEKLDNDFLICECFCVNVGDIRLSCSDLGEVNLDHLQERFQLGRGCQSCIKDADSWIKKIF